MSESQSLYVVLSANVSGFSGKMVAAGRQVETFGKQVVNMSDDSARALDDVGSTAGKIGATAAVGLALAGKAAMDWESQWAGVTKTVDGTDQQMIDLEQGLRTMAKTMSASHQEIAATAEAAGQLGVAVEDIEDFTRTMVMLGETTNMTAEEAATSFAQFMNVMGTSADDVDELGNSLVALGNNGASTEAGIVALMQRLSGAGSLVNATEQDVMALAAAMANLGVPAELGGGAIQRVFLGINTAVSEQGDLLNDFADLAGVSAQEFANQWKTSPIEAFDGVIQGLGNAKAEGQDLTSVLGNLGIKGTQNLQVMLRLAGAGDQLTDSLELSRQAWEDNSALLDEYKKRAATTGAQVQIAWNQIKDAAISGGEAILPVVAKVVGIVGDMADVFGDLPDPIQKALLVLLGITAAAGVLTFAGIKMIGMTRSAKKSLADLGVTAALTGGGLAKAGVGARLYATNILRATTNTNAATRAMARNAIAASRQQRAMGAMFKGAGLLAGVAVLSQVSDGFDASNAAMGAMMGSMLGPWGAAAGGMVGGLKDIGNYSKKTADEVSIFDRALDDSKATMESVTNAMLAQKQEWANYQSEILDRNLGETFLDVFTNPIESGATFLDVLDGTNDRMVRLREASREASGATTDMLNTVGMIGMDLGGDGDYFKDARTGADLLAPALADLGPIMDRINPAMEELGLTAADLGKMDDAELAAFRAEVVRLTIVAESGQGRIDGFTDAVGGLGSEVETVADKASALSDALDALLDPASNVEATTDSWRQSLQELGRELVATAGFSDNSKEAMANRAMTRDYVDGAKDRLVAMAEAGAGERKMAAAVAQTRQELIQSGVDAGFSRRAMRARTKELNLTPGMVKTVMQLAGVNQFDLQLADAKATLKGMPKKVVTAITNRGIPKTKADVRSLVKDLDLTKKQRQAVVTLKDQATKNLKAVKQALDGFGKQKAEGRADVNVNPGMQAIRQVDRALDDVEAKKTEPTIDVNNVPGMTGIQSFLTRLQSIPPSKTTILTTRSINITENRVKKAGGGLVTGPGGPTDDLIDVSLSNREYVQRAAAVEKYGVAFMDDINNLRYEPRQALAAGGRVGGLNHGAGARYGSSQGGSGRPGVVVINNPAPRQMVLDIDGERFTAYVRREADDVAMERIGSAASTGQMTGRMNW